MRALTLLSVSLLLAACGGGGDDGGGGSGNDPDVWHFRGVNAIQDAPVVQFYVDDTAVSLADYGAASEYKPAHTGERTLKLGVRNPPDLVEATPGFSDIDENDSYEFAGPTDYTLVAAGTVAEPQKYLITDTSQEDVEDNQVEYQVINAAPGSGALDVYLRARGAGIEDLELLDHFAPGEYSERANLDLEIASGDEEDDTRSVSIVVQVRDGATVLFTSPTLTIPEQTRLLLVLADNVGAAGGSPVKMLIVGGIGAGAAGVAYDRLEPTELRFANLSPDAGALDLIVGSDTSDVFAANVTFGTQSPYGLLEPATYNSIATPTGNPGSFLFVNTFTTVVGRSITMYAQGELGSLRGVVVTDDRRPVPTEARFRFLHAATSQSSAAVDVYLTVDGEPLDVSGDDAQAPNAADVAYRGLSAQLALAAGSYDVYVTRANSSTVRLGPVDLDLTNGSVQTLALVDSPAGELQLLPVDDARN